MPSGLQSGITLYDPPVREYYLAPGAFRLEIGRGGSVIRAVDIPVTFAEMWRDRRRERESGLIFRAFNVSAAAVAVLERLFKDHSAYAPLGMPSYRPARVTVNGHSYGLIYDYQTLPAAGVWSPALESCGVPPTYTLEVCAHRNMTTPPTTAKIENFRGKYRFLSNFADEREGVVNGVEYNGVMYATSEHAYQAAKFPHLPGVAEEIRNAVTAGDTKRIARKYKASTRSDWTQVSITVMRDILRSKFERHPALARKLIDTGDAELIESNTWSDHFWGVCRGIGENHLGKLLMELRADLRAKMAA